MITGLLLQAFDSFISWVSNLLPAWSIPSQLGETLTAVFAYISYFNQFLPISDGIIPAMQAMFGVWSFLLVYGVFSSMMSGAAAVAEVAA